MREKKKALRKEIEEKRKHLDAKAIADSNRQITENLLALPQYASANIIFCFVGTTSEIDTKPFILWALAENKRVCVPRCIKLGVMHAYEITSLSDLQPGAYGIEEPKESCALIDPAAIDFAVIPCVTCNSKGFRLGYGGGFYDRYLAGQSFGTAVLCRAALMSEDVPAEEHDVEVGVVVTDTPQNPENSINENKPLC